jgi:multidrug efflux pump subunit AcrB
MVSYFARHPTAANLLMITFVVLGIIGALRMVRETFPDFESEFVHIQVIYKGASAQDVEETICQRVEEAIEGVEGIESVESIAREGMALVRVELQDGYSMRELLTDVENEVEQIQDFPEETEEPLVWEFEQEDRVLQVAISGEMPRRHLYDLADEIKEEMLALEGVSRVNLAGFGGREIRVEVREEALLAYGLTIGDIARVIQSQSLDLPSGSIETENREIIIRVVDQKRTADEFRDLVAITSPEGITIPLRAIATITDTFEDDWNRSTYMGRPAAILDISKSDTGDSIRISNTIRDYLGDKRMEIPEGIEMVPMVDISSIVQDRLSTLTGNGWMGFVLVFITLWLFLNIRLSLWVALGIPISFLGTIWLMGWLGLSLNMISMVSLILALGLIVDDAIVIGENIFDHIEQGKDPLEAAISGTYEVASGVISSMLTTVAVFLPLLLMEGEIGKVLRVMPFGVIAALTVSLIEAFLILPNHLAHSLKRESKSTRIRKAVANSLNWTVDRLYGPSLDWFLHHRWVAIAMGAMLFLTALGQLAGGRLKFQPFPDLDGDILVARVLMPQGTEISETEKVVERIEAALAPVNEKYQPMQPDGQNLVRHYSTTYGVNMDADEQGSHVATILVELLKADVREGRADDIIADWEAGVGEIPGAIAVTYDQAEVGPGGKAIDLQLVGRDLRELQEAGYELKRKIASYPGIQNLLDNLRPGKWELRVQLKPSARSLGVTSAELSRQLRGGFFWQIAEDFQRGDDNFEVHVRLNPEDRASLSDLDDFKIVLADGSQVPFHEVARVEQVRGFAKIVREGGSRSLSVTANVDERKANAAQIMEELKRDYFPEFLERHPGVELNLEGQEKETAKTVASLRRGMILGLIMMFILLSFVFESYIDPFVVMLTIPFGLIGAVYGHLLFGYDWTMPSMVGFVSLAGIIVNDSIVLVTFIKARMKAGEDPREAVAQAGRRRFRPVFLTTATTVAGLMPMMLETSLQAQILVPLVVSIACGLGFATFLTLVLIPCFYSLVVDFKDWMGIRRARRVAAEQARA